MPDEWPFDQNPDVAAITTRQVLEDGFPILRVTHRADDHSWAFVCGTTNDVADARVVAMDEALNIDRTISEVADLPPGRKAWRKETGGAWEKARDEEA
jgi:hypothetical protein